MKKIKKWLIPVLIILVIAVVYALYVAMTMVM